MEEYRVELGNLPTPGELFDVDGNIRDFSPSEIAALADGLIVGWDHIDAHYEIAAPVWAAVFNSQRPELRDSLLVGAFPDTLKQQAKELAVQVVGAKNANYHNFNIILKKDVPEWHGKARHDARQRREKDDVCAWQHVQGF